jgi:hypothetical protein
MNNEESKGETFAEIARKHGEEAAINAGIAADPDTVELDSETIRKAPAVRAVAPHLIERHQPLRNKAPAE